MANVITYGTFDLFHIGHLRLLQRVRSRYAKRVFAMGSDPIVRNGEEIESSADWSVLPRCDADSSPGVHV